MVNVKLHYSLNRNAISCAPKSDRVPNHPLIDRGSNGGIADEEARDRYNHPDCRVGIRGVDNHEINSIHIAIAGGFTKITTGDAIIVM